MREWARVVFTAKCAYCGKVLRDGDPVLLVSIDGLKRKFSYCAECKGPAPPDLPPAGPRQQRTSRMTPIGRISIPKAMDWKQKQSGEREPGQEG